MTQASTCEGSGTLGQGQACSRGALGMVADCLSGVVAGGVRMYPLGLQDGTMAGKQAGRTWR